jgi:hypothetical protein
VKQIFGKYLPDLPDHMSDGLLSVSNAYPMTRAWRPVGQWVGNTSPLPSPCLGAASFVSPTGYAAIIAGTSTGLYRQTAGGWQLLQSGFSVPPDGRWRFAQFGGLAICTDQTDAMVKVNIDTGVVSLLGGAPPRVQTLAVVQNFLVGGIVDGDTATIAWCGENNAEFWQYGQRKSDYNIFPDGGAVNGILGGEFGLILQRNAIRRMSYVGGNILFRLDKIASNVGCVTVHSVAQYGELGFWYSDSGFKMWDGASIRSIGFEQVDATFAALYGVADWPKMSAAIDGPRNMVFWSMAGKIWGYNWLLESWTVVDYNAQIITGGYTKTVTVDEQDPAVGVPDDILENVGLLSFDDPSFNGGAPRFYVFNSSNALGSFAGANMAASWGMRNVELVDGRDVRLRRVRPMTDAVAGLTYTANVKQRLGDAGANINATVLNSTGEMPVRARGRYAKQSFAIAAGQAWTYCQGVDIKAARGAAR